MKLLAKIIIVIAIFIGGFYVGYEYALAPSNGSLEVIEEKQEIKVNLAIDFGNDEIRNFDDIILLENSTVFNLLEKVTLENNLEFSYKNYGELGAMVESIDGRASDALADLWWQYWVNGNYAEIGASQYQLKDNDIVEWKYIKGQIN